MNNFGKEPSKESQEGQSLKDKYVHSADDEGFVSLTAGFCQRDLRRQSASIAGLLDGQEGLEPDYNLGEGIRYKGTSDKPERMSIHIDDLDEFAGRVREHYGEEVEDNK